MKSDGAEGCLNSYMSAKIIAILTLCLILIETLLRQFLSGFYKERTLPYMTGFTIFTTFFIIVSSVNFFRYFEPLTAVIMIFFVLFPLHIHYLFAPLLFGLNCIHIASKKNEIYIPGNFALFCLAFYCIIFWTILLLTFISFFFDIPLFHIKINIYWVVFLVVSVFIKIFEGKMLKYIYRKYHKGV